MAAEEWSKSVKKGKYGTKGTLDIGALLLTTDLAVAHGGTGISAVAKGSVLVANAADTLSALDGATASDQGTNINGLLAYKNGTDTLVWTNSIDGGTF